MLSLLMLAGCQRGCFWSWLGKGNERGGEGIPKPGQNPLPLNVVDCPDGLARCVDGTLEVSRLSSYPVPCSGPAEKCRCAWEVVEPCAHGCVADGLEMALAKENARQLCALPNAGTPEANSGFSAPPSPAAADAGTPPCGGELYRCSDALVSACDDDTPVPIARCLRGCAEQGASLDDDIPRESAVAILCSRL